MKQRNWHGILILILAAGWIAITAAFFPTETSTRTQPVRNFLAPAFTLTTLNGEITGLEAGGGQITILNLWASWCLPCRSEMPALQQIHEDYSGKGVKVLAVNMTSQDNLADIEKFVTDNALTFPVLLDTTGEIGRMYQMRALPTTFFINQQGIIHDVVVGGPMPEALIRAKISEMEGQP